MSLFIRVEIPSGTLDDCIAQAWDVAVKLELDVIFMFDKLNLPVYCNMTLEKNKENIKEVIAIIDYNARRMT